MNNGIMKRARRVLCLIGWLLLALPVQAASFDCAKAGVQVEKLICGDAEISKLDEELNAVYKTALQDGRQAETIRQAQKQWMKERNGCFDAVCVKRAYEARLSSLTVMHTPSGDGAATKQGIEDNSQDGQQYQFQFTKGKGVPVCDAYLERLNKTEYVKPPYCDRPENDSVKGFAKLNRVPLSPGEVHDLQSIVFRFMGMANYVDMDWSDMRLQEQMAQDKRYKLTEGSDKALQMALDAGEAKIWRYDPPVDIDNDGVPDNVQVWHGPPVFGEGGTVCGEHSFRAPDDPPVRQPQIVFVVAGNNVRLDISRTNNIFAHPVGGYRFYSKRNQKWVTSHDFRPIGKSMGIFKYQDRYYFDTFYDGWGDFENKRQSEYAFRNNESIINTLAVFLHKDGNTKQVCEYLMTDNETQNERGTK